MSGKMVKCLDFFFKAIVSAIYLWSNLTQLSPVRLQRITKKALFPSLLMSLLITYLITLSLEKGSTVLFW